MITPARTLDPVLEKKLVAVARVRRERKLHRAATRRWMIVGAAGAGLLGWQLATGASLPYGFPGLLGLIGLMAAIGWRRGRREPVDLAGTTRELEASFPELGVMLRTAFELVPDGSGSLGFLQRRVVNEALEHERRTLWVTQARRELPGARWSHFGAMAAAFVIAGFVLGTGKEVKVDRVAPVIAGRGPTQIVVTPGNAEVERGTTVVVAARFTGRVPEEAELAWKTGADAGRGATMARSLSDPVYALALPAAKEDVVYRVSYDGRKTEEFKLTVYELPVLVRADAALDFPEYTGLADRRIEDTRRVSAVEGTTLRYEFQVNKALRRAALREKDGKEIGLEVLNKERTRFAMTLRLEKSARYTLRLEDDRGRANSAPDDIRIEVQPNRRPELKLVSPRGDQRVSPLEEVRLQAEARDDFGLLDYGLAVATGDGAPEFRSARTGVIAARTVEAKFQELLPLEERKAQVGQLVTWFAWADDFGPDGKVRRTSGDLFFAEVRPLDEVFNEDNSGGANEGGQGGGGEEAAELIETQRQISIAIWKLKQQGGTAKKDEELRTLIEAQKGARAQLDKQRAEADAETKRKAAEADKFMRQAEDGLADARKTDSARPLDPAWAGAQGAYQALLRMAPKNYRVSQNSTRNRGQGGGRSNQRQVNQLEFKQQENRYETESAAQAPTTAAEREQLQILSKLREMARRQQDVNQRLQELQTALSAAKDEAERDEVRRELKRLEEEQRRLLAEADEVRQRMDGQPPGARREELQQQLERTREEMRRSGEKLGQGEVSEALAAGARARENLDTMREDFRQQASNQFAEQLREARRTARGLTEQQQRSEQALTEMQQSGGRSLDNSGKREAVAAGMDEERAGLERLRGNLKQLAEDAETSEPGLHRKLHDLLREQGGSTAGEKLETGAQLLRRGLVKQTQQLQPGIGEELKTLQRGVERAAESVLGDETAELRFAQREIEELSRQLQRERTAAAGGQAPGEASGGAQGERGTAAGAGTGRENQPGGEKPAGAGSDAGRGNGDTRTAQAENRGGRAPGADGAGQTPGAGKGQGTGAGQSGGGAQGEGRTRGEGAGPGAGGSRGGNLAGGDVTGGDVRPDGAGGGGGAGSLQEALRGWGETGNGGGTGGGPLTGEGFGEWTERLRTVEELVQSPEIRQQLAAAREQAETMRREFKRHSAEPKWGLVDAGIASPLSQARVLLRQELLRREQPEALQPVDRDPVPEKYAESVKQYYEALGR